MQKSAVWEMKMQMDRCYGNHFAPRTIEANYFFGAMLSNGRLYQGAGIKK